MKISIKKHKKYKGSLSAWRITCSFTRCSSSRYVVLHCNQKTILCDVEETTCTTNSFVVLPRFQTTAVDCAHELINGWNKRVGWQNSPKSINGECWIRLGRVAKNGMINKRGVPSIRNSRVLTLFGACTDCRSFWWALLIWWAL